jgi:hypothetical protein
MLGDLFRKLGLISDRAPTQIIALKVDSKPAADRPPAQLPPNKDAWEGWYNSYGSEGDRPLTMEAEISYTDRDGQSTKRQITTKHFGPSGNGEPSDMMILAYCHLRRENRTFTTSRIREFVNLATGEVARDIPEYLVRLYEASPAGQTVRLLDRIADELTVLLYVARGDGRVSPKEKAALVAFLQHAGPSVELDMETLSAALAAAPSQAGLKRALKAVVDKGQSDTVLAGVEALAGARSKMDDFTGAAASLVRKRLSKGGAAQLTRS